MNHSEQLFARAQKSIPGGVNSPVRAFKGVGGTPVFIRRANGAYLYDADDKRYIDYIGSWGPMIVGHAHPEVIDAVTRAAGDSLSFGAPTELEIELAEKVTEIMPSMEQVRMVNSGTEATMSAIRLARGFTGRDKLLKFEGCYHGHADPLLVKAGSGALTLGVPTSPGVSAAVAQDTVTLPYNDVAALENMFAEIGDQIACVILEPIAGNMNCVIPSQDFHQRLRQLCDQAGAILIFDEVMTGFRVAAGGAQALFDIKPDLTTLGKVIGGGMPVGAFGGRRDIMSYLAPLGPVYQAGTLSGNPLAMSAGLATLKLIGEDGFYARLEQRCKALTEGLQKAADSVGIDVSTVSVGGMFGLFFTGEAVVSNFEQVMACDTAAFGRFFHAMLARGVYLAPSAFEAGFISAAHTEADIDATVQAATEAFAEMKR